MDMRICIIALIVLILSGCAGPADTGETDDSSGEGSEPAQNATADTSASPEEGNMSTGVADEDTQEPVQQVNDTEEDMDMQELDTVKKDLDFTI